MGNQNSRKENIETFVGKVRGLEGDEVRVSLWGSVQQEIVANLPRKYFPQKELEVGQIFKYRARVAVEMVPVREISAEEIARLYAEIEKSLPQDEF